MGDLSTEESAFAMRMFGPMTKGKGYGYKICYELVTADGTGERWKPKGNAGGNRGPYGVIQPGYDENCEQPAKCGGDTRGDYPDG